MAQCNVNTLLANAACFECVSPGMWEILELQLLCEILNNGGVALNIKSQTVALDSLSTFYFVNHGLGRLPLIMRAVLLCNSHDVATGYLQGMELELPGSLFAAASGGAPPQPYADTGKVYLSITQAFVGHEATWPICPVGGGNAVGPTSFNNFTLKFYYA